MLQGHDYLVCCLVGRAVAGVVNCYRCTAVHAVVCRLRVLSSLLLVIDLRSCCI